MTCYRLHDETGKFIAIACGRMGEPCRDCGDVGGFRCDFPLGNGRTCDRSICKRHGHEVAKDTHYCESHHETWLVGEWGGDVIEHLVAPQQKALEL